MGLKSIHRELNFFTPAPVELMALPSLAGTRDRPLSVGVTWFRSVKNLCQSHLFACGYCDSTFRQIVQYV